MKLQKNVSLFSRTGLMQMLLVAFTYWCFLAITNYTLMKLPWLQLRFATFVPVVGGIMFGLPGAVGAALGNLLGDIGSDTPLPLVLSACLLNFFLAYLPYRLWFGWHGKKALHFISDSASFARFTIITIINGFIFAVSLSALIDVCFDVHGGVGFNFFILFSNNYDFPILLGLPLLLFLRKKVRVIYYPAPQPEKRRGGMQLKALSLMVLLDIFYLMLSQYGEIPSTLSLLFVSLNLLLLSYVCTLPSECEELQEDSNTGSLASSTTELLLIFSTGFILLALLGMLLMAGDTRHFFRNTLFWQSAYIILSVPLNGSFLFFYFLLRWLEGTIAAPLTALSNRARYYLETGDDRAEAPTDAPAKNEVEVLDRSFTKMTQDLKRYMADLTAASEAKHALQAQLDVAAQIQQGTLPNLDEVNTRLQANHCPYVIKGSMQSARNVGGDMFDSYLIDDDHLLLNVGDVSGKGIPAALFAMVTQSLLSNSTYDKAESVTGLSAVVENVNNALEENNQELLFVTLWVGVLELSTGVLTYINAGHNPPLLAKTDGSGPLQLLEEISGPVLGLMPEIPYTSYTTVLPPGHKLLIFTDGLNEAENAAHEFYGDERLREAFLRATAPEEIMAAINSFVGDAPPSDDKTYLWLERK